MFPAMLPPLLLTLRVLRSSAEVLGSLGLAANTIPSKHVTNITASLMIERSKKMKGSEWIQRQCQWRRNARGKKGKKKSNSRRRREREKKEEKKKQKKKK